MDELLNSADEPPLAGRLDEHLDDVALHTEYRRLVAEQAALRRLGTLVARGGEPSEVSRAVAEEMRRCLDAFTAGIWRFEPTGEVTLVAAAATPAALAKWPVGTRISIDANTLATVVYRTGLPARIDSYDNIAGSIPARVRAVGVRAAVGVPIIVDGSVRALAAVGSAEPGPMPADTEVRISRFAELVASVVVAGYRDEQKRQLLGDVSQRPFLVDSLLEGRVTDRWSLSEAASWLRLPASGPFVVIAAEVPVLGSEALPAVESKLRGLDVYSAWRLQPDLQAGIVHVKSERQLDEILGLVSRLATNRSRRQCVFRRSARHAAGSVFRQSDASGPAGWDFTSRGVRRLGSGHRGSQCPTGDGEINRKCFERL